MYIFASNGRGISNTSIKVIIQICIETNIRQRGIGNPNPIKLGKCFQFLNEYYGFHQGNGSNQHEQKEKLFTFANSDIPSNQTELAESYGITKQTMNNYMRMASMIPELEDLVDTGILAPTTALAMMRNLSEDSLKFIWVHTVCTQK